MQRGAQTLARGATRGPLRCNWRRDLQGHAAIFGDEPREHFAKNGVGVLHANLFVGLPERDRNKVEEGVNERRVHVDDVIASFLGHAVRCFDGSTGVRVDGTGIIGHVVGLGGEGIVAIGIRLRAGVVCVECVVDGKVQQFHLLGDGRFVRLRTFAHVLEQIV